MHIGEFMAESKSVGVITALIGAIAVIIAALIGATYSGKDDCTDENISQETKIKGDGNVTIAPICSKISDVTIYK